MNKIRILVGYTGHPISIRDSNTKCDSDRHLHGKLTLPSNASALHGKVVICHAGVGFCVGFGCIGKVTLPKQRKNHVRLLVGLIIFRSKTRVVPPGIKSKGAVFDA